MKIHTKNVLYTSVYLHIYKIQGRTIVNTVTIENEFVNNIVMRINERKYN